MDAAMYEQLRTDRDRRPLLNRALAGGYTPGSILKPLIALAALEAGVVTPEEEIECTGRFMVGNHPIRCWKRSGHGFLSLRHAIEHSCNPYMMEIGTRTGLDRLRPFLQAAGIGSAPDLDLPFNRADAAGILPTRNAGGHRWLAVDTAYLSMGQGIIGLSPLQAALYTAALANGGRVYRPFLVREILGLDGREIQRTVPMVTSRLPVSQEDLQVVREGMWLVVNGDDATAEQARTPLMTLAGKTGTAEVGTRENRTLNTWFIAFGPWEAPRFAVAALVERGMSGGRTAAPMVREFIEGWYGQAEGPGDG
jgi:penicillin-binding protein 2